MGIFSFLKKPAGSFVEDSTEYERFKKLYASCTALSYSDKVDAYIDFLNFAKTVNEKSITSQMQKESEKNRNYYYHSVFGCVFFDKPFLPSIIERAERQLRTNRQKLDSSIDFQSELENITPAPIWQDEEFKLTRCALSEMPEIRFSTITKSFNMDKLPVFVVFDVETNGLKVQGGRILELSAIRYEDFEPVAVFSTLINPGKPISADSTAIHGITDADVAYSPTLSAVAPAFLEFIGKSPLVGYNLMFDLKFLFSAGIDVTTPKRKMFDVLEITRKAYKKECDSFKLVDICNYLKIYRNDAHRSASDCLATGKVFAQAIKEITY